MNWFRNMKIGVKLGMGFAAVLGLVIVLGVFCLFQLSKLNANVLDIGTNWMASITYISQLRFDASKVRRWELNYLFSEDKGASLGNLNEAIAAILEDEKLYEPTIASQHERDLYQGFRAAWDKHMVVKDRYFELLSQGKDKEAEALTISAGFATFAAAADRARSMAKAIKPPTTTTPANSPMTQ